MKKIIDNSNLSVPKNKNGFKIWRNAKNSWDNKKINHIKQQKKLPRQWSRF